MIKLLVCILLIVNLIGYLIFKLGEQTIYYKPVINFKGIVIMVFIVGLLGVSAIVSLAFIIFFILYEKVINDDELWDEMKDDNMKAHSQNIDSMDLREYSNLVSESNKQVSINEQKLNELIKDINNITINNTDNEVKSLVSNSLKLKLMFHTSNDEIIHIEILNQLNLIKILIDERINITNDLVNDLKVNERYLNYFKEGEL